MALPTIAAATACGGGEAACHPAYEPCLPNHEGDALDCNDLNDELKPVSVKQVGNDPYRLDADRNGTGCEFEASLIGDLLEGLTNN